MISGVIILAGMVVFSTIGVETALWVPMLAIALFGLGAGMTMPTVTDSIMAAVPVSKAGIGSAMIDLSRELGIALGVAILGSLVASLYRSDVKDALDGLLPTEAVETVGDSLGSLGAVTSGLEPDAALTVTEVANQTFVDALNIGFLAAAAFVGVAILVAAVMIPRRARSLQVDENQSQAADSESTPSFALPVDLAPSAAD